MPRAMIDAMCVARVYSRLAENVANAPFIAKYCAVNSLAVADCKLLRLCYPKPVTFLPAVEQFVENSGASTKWLVCATAGSQHVCHPGPMARYSDNKLTYKTVEVRSFDAHEKSEAKTGLFKKRKRAATKVAVERAFPATVQQNVAEGNLG